MLARGNARTMAPGIAVCRLPFPATAAAVAPMAFAWPRSASFARRPSYRTFREERSRCTTTGLGDVRLHGGSGIRRNANVQRILVGCPHDTAGATR